MSTSERQVIEALLEAYRQGCFPMADPEGRAGPPGGVVWLNPDPRGIIPLKVEEGLRIPRRLRDRVRSRRFVMTSDVAFEDVMRGCSLPRPAEPHTWIDERLITAYTALHRAGSAHSLEAWLPEGDPRLGPGNPGWPRITSRHGVLVGGVYGVHIGAAFFAESKFHRADLGGTDASKVALAHLILHLKRRGFELLDTQFWNEHIDQFGCREIPRAEYLERLGAAVGRAVAWQPFEPGPDAAGLAKHG